MLEKIMSSSPRSLFAGVSDRDNVKKAISSIKEKVDDFERRQHTVGRMKLKESAERDDGLGKVEVIGREKEKKEIMDRLMPLGRSVDIPLVMITGITGIGKTKLAELVFSDKQVKDHFDSLIWFNCARENFDVESIANRVSASSSAVTSGKSYLLVLDDMRIELHDKDFTMLLNNLRDLGLCKGAILVTTRSSSSLVANTTASTVMKYPLQGLNEEETWSLFQQIIRHSNSRNVIQDIGTTLVGMCRGVPLVIITLAELLNSRDSQVSEAQVAELKEEFLRKLQNIYCDQLSQPEKDCFAYCSLFLADYLIDANILIHLWMAEGFLTHSDHSSSSSPEELGRKYLNNFLRTSIFEDIREDECCRMNRLMHDLASFMAGDENMIVDLDGQKVHDRVQRASLNFSLDVSRTIPNSLIEKAKKLKTFLLLAKTQSWLPRKMMVGTLGCEKIIKSFKELHMLDLHGLGIEKVPRSIGKLKNLRFLDLSLNNIEKLPNSITKLIYLQTLKLSKCHNLKELPKDLKDLSRLRHLDIEGCLNLTHMPPGLSKLTSLQTLSHFIGSKKYPMGGLGELTGLNNLRGNLEILYLERFKLPASSDATENKYLENKEHLERLTFRWNHHNDRGSHPHDEESLELLEPHPNLRVLYIAGYKGQKISDWLSSLNCLVKFSLYNCHRCISLPPLDGLPSLKVLDLQQLYSLEFIAKNSHHTSEIEIQETEIHEIEDPSFSLSRTAPRVPLFPSLNELKISDCPKLRSWWEKEKTGNNIPSFACISKLHVQYCPKLTCMPLYPTLDKELVLVDSNVNTLWDTILYGSSLGNSVPHFQLKSMLITNVEEHSQLRSWLKGFTYLEKLHIRDSPHLEFLPQGFMHLSSLQHLTIENCPKLDLDYSRTEMEKLENLRSITIREIPNLNSLPSWVISSSSLKDLEIHQCRELTYLPKSIGNLTSLGTLVISECIRLASLPEELGELKSLHTLIIIDCPLLLPRCQRETGNDWPQIAHIQNIQVKQIFQEL